MHESRSLPPFVLPRSLRLALLAWIAVGLATTAIPARGQEEAPPEHAAYLRFRAWINAQPSEVSRDEIRARYRAHLASQGLSSDEIAAELELLGAGRQRREIEMWNRLLTAEQPRFNTEPNQFLVRMISGVEPGRALDVGMGQGRNAIYLATQGWEVTGFDPADRAVALAQKLAEEAGVEIDTRVQTDDEFVFGQEQWDLVVMSYVSVRPLVDRVVHSLRPGGRVIVEAFHHDATAGSSIGRGVVFENNELLQLFSGLRVVRYEDEVAVADFGRGETRVVRLAALKEP